MSASQDALRTIAYISTFDKKRAARLQEEYNRRKTDKNDVYYAGTYSAPTNQAVSNLTALGFDTSRLNQDWYKQNESWIQDNLEYRSGTTNAPSAPTKKSSWENRVAYELYQWGNSEEQTQKAEKQWNQLQKELAYYAGNPEWNYSDDYILNNKIDWSKYNLLTEMDEDPNPLNPKEYNRAIGYSKDAVNGTLWAARNGGGTGDDMLNAGMYYLGEGNQWKEDPKVSAKLNPENPDFNPYDIGSTNMHKEGQILGMYSASRDWVDSDEFKEMYYSDDPEEKAAAENWYNAEMRLTRPAEDARDALYGYIDSFLSDGVTDAGVVRAGIDAALDGGKLYTYQKGNETVYTTKKPSVKDYKEIDLGILNKIDMTVGKTDENGNRSLPVNDEKDLLTFTRGIGYKYDSTIQQVEELCARNAEILKEADTVNDIIDLGMGPLNPALFETEPATVGTEQPQMQSPGQIAGQDTRTGTQPGMQGTPSPEINTGAQAPAGTGSDSVKIDAAQDAMKNGRMSSPTDLPAAQPEPAQVPTTPAPPKITEAEAGEIEAGNKKINEARTAVETEDVTTETETAAMKYAGSVAFNRIKNQLTAIRINPGIMQGVVQKDINIASKGVMDSGLNYAHSIAEYETTKIRNDANEQRYAELEAKYGDIQYYQKEAPEAIEKQIGDYTVILTLDTANPDGPKYVVSDIHSSYATYNEIMDTAWGEDLKKQAEMLGEPESKEAAKILNAQSVVAANGEQGAVEIEEYKNLSAQISKDSQALEQGRENYDKAADGLKKTVNKLNMMADSAYMMGVDPSGVRDAFRFLDDMLNYHDEPAVPMQDRTKLEMIDAYAEYTGMEYDSAKKSEILHKQISDVEARIKKIDEDIAYAQGIGYQIPGNYARNMQLKREDLENEKKALEYSAILTDTAPEELETAINAAKAFEEKYGEGSMNYWVNLFDNADGFRTIMKNDRYTLREDGEDASEYGTITEDEKKTYYYLLGKKILEMGGSLDEALENIGKDSKAAEAALREIFSDASEYEKFMENDQSGYGLWNNREYDQSVEYGQGMVQSGFGGGVEANLMATGATVAESVASALYTFDRLISGGRFNEKSFANRVTGTKNAIREETRKSIDEYYKDNPLMKTIANIGYEIYCNRGDSAMNAMFFGMLFPELGNPILSELLGSTPMGFTAGLNAATEAVRNGANTEQAWLILGTTFMAETMTEALTRSNIMEALGEGRELTKETLGQFFKEWLTKSGVEEMFGESANDLIENFFNRGAAEWFDNPNFESDHQKLIDKYYAEGYTEPGAAEAKAYEEEMKGIAHTAFVSYLSAGADVVAKVGRAAVNTVKAAADVVNEYRKGTKADQRLGGSNSMLDNMIRDYKKAKSGVPAAVAMGGPNTNKNASGQEAGAAAPETMQAAQTAADERFTKAEQGRREAQETLDAAKEEYDRAYSNARSKEIKLDNAKKGLKAAQKGGNQEHIAKAQAAVDAAREEVNQARTARTEAKMKRNEARELMERADSEYDEAGRAIAAENATPDQKQASADVATLQRVEGSTPVTQTETLASILDNGDGDEVASEQASAAATLLMKRFGENANYIVQQVMNGTAKTAESRELVTTALQNAALGNGAATAVMQSADFQNASPEQKVQMLVATIAQDQANQAVQQNIAASVRDFRIAMGVNNLAANGHFNGAVSAQAAAQAAGKDVSKAKTALTEKEQALDQAMTDVRQKSEAVASDPSDQNMKAHQAAVTTAENMDESRKQYEDHLAKEQEKKDAADAKATQETENAMKTAREQAAQEVDQVDQQRAADQQAAAEQQAEQERIAQEEAAQAQAEQDEMTGKADEDRRTALVEQLLDNENLQGEEREDRRVKLMNQLDKVKVKITDLKQSVSNTEGRLALYAFERKLGIPIQFADLGAVNSSRITRGKYENGVIYLNENLIKAGKMTVGQALVEASLHEIIHSVRNTDSYNSYRSVVMDALYGAQNSKDALSLYQSNGDYRAAIDTLIADRAAAGDQNFLGDDLNKMIELADEEIVADFARINLSEKAVVQRLMDAGMGGKMRNTLHNINQALKNYFGNMTGEERRTAENLRRAERNLQKAINEAAKTSVHPEGGQFSISQFAQSAGLNFDQDTLELRDKNGDLIDGVNNKVTADMMNNTPVGLLIDLARDGSKTQKGDWKFTPTISKETAQAQKQMFADLMNMVAQYKDSDLVWEIASSTMFSALKSNSDPQYSTTVDFGTVCAKTQEIINVMSRVMLEKGRGLTREEVLKVYNETANAGLTVPCPVCYVFSRWMGVPSLLNQMSQYQKRFVSLNEDGSINMEKTAEDANKYIKAALEKYGSKDKIDDAKTSLVNRMKTQENNRTNALSVLNSETATEEEKAKAQAKHDEAIKNLDALQKELGEVEAYNWVTQALCLQKQKGKTKYNVLDNEGNYVIDPSFELTPDNVLFDLRKTGEFAKFTKNWQYRNTRGAGMGKAIMPYSGESIGDVIFGTTRKSDIMNPFLTQTYTKAADGIKNAVKRARQQNLIGGQRLQSTSDFRPEWGLDYMMAFLELQAVGSKVQMYTKVAEAVDLLASMGGDINLSIMGKGKGWHVDENGNQVLDFSDVTGMNYETAKELKDKFDNVQMILVGMNDTHIKLALANPDIDFVIPWHSSGNSKDTLASLISSASIGKEQLETSSDYTDTQSDEASENQTAEQKKLWDLRMKILQGQKLTEEDRRIINSDDYLAPLYERFTVKGKDDDCYQVKLAKDQAKQIFPYEYWNKSLTKDQANANGQAFIDYCQHFGIVPRFSGVVKKNDDGTFSVTGNFAGAIYDDQGNITGYDPEKMYDGYWKVLIDRPMYDNKGNYREQQVVDVTKAKIGALENGKLTNSDMPLKTSAMYGPNYSEQEKTAVDNSLAAIEQQAGINGGKQSVMGDLTEADRDLMSDAVNDYADAVARGDMEAAQEDVDFYAEQAGYTIKAYHGSDADKFTVFKPGNRGEMWFASTESTAYDRKNMYNTYLKMDNPVEFTYYIGADSKFDPTFVTEAGRSNGHDGAIVHFMIDPNYVDMNLPILSDFAKTLPATDSFGDNFTFMPHGKDRENLAKPGETMIEFMKRGSTETLYDWYCVYNPTQIKSADPVTYDDNGNVIPLDQRFTDSPDIRYSTEGELTEADRDLIAADEERQNNEALLSSGALTQEELDAYMQNTGTAEEQNPEMPTGQRQWGRVKAQQSDVLHQKVKDHLYKNSEYTKDTNQAQIDRAVEWVLSMATENDPDGYHAAVDAVTSTDFDYLSADGQAKMIVTMAMAATNNNPNLEMRIADAYNQQGTDIGRMLQSRKIFRLMSPIGRRMALESMAAKINQQYRNENKDVEVHLSHWVLEAAAEAETESDFEKVQRAAEAELASQMPSTWQDKLQTWRMLAMLGNPRTHIRNIVGNALFMPIVGIKNLIGEQLESIASSKGIYGYQLGEKTKAHKYSQDAIDFAAKDVETMKDTLTGEAKYGAESRIKQKQKAFGQGDGILSRTIGKAVQASSDAVGIALEWEDWQFLNRHYRNALASYMTANNLTSEQMTGDTLDKARAYAVEEAQKATYRDANAISTKLNQWSKDGGALGFITDAVLPFKKTPANILRRGMEYSPVGLIKSWATAKKSLELYNAWEKNGKKGNMPKGAKSANQVLDSIAAGLTGTAISALGALLFGVGAVKLKLGDDDDELEKEKGSQEYSLELFGTSVTLDWAAPVCMPFFTGAAICKTVMDQYGEDFNVSTLADAIFQMADPVFNLSMLDGVSSLLRTTMSSNDKNPIGQIMQKIGSNYLGSMVPTLFGSAARTIDPVRRKNYTKSGSTVWDSLLEQVENKIPFLSRNNIPYRNVWGEAEESDQFEAFMENFLLPGYVNRITEDDLTDELQRIYDVTGDKGVIPKYAEKTLSVNGSDTKLNDKQYDDYAVARGQTAKKLLNELIKRPEFIALSETNPEAQVQLVKDVWSYAKQVGKHEVFPDTEFSEKWMASAYNEGNVIDKIFAREEEKARNADASDHMDGLYSCIDHESADGLQAHVEGLKRAGRTEKSIRSSLMKHYGDLYKKAVIEENEEYMNAIKYGLEFLDLGNYSFDDSTFDKWEADAWSKQEEKQEEEELDNLEAEKSKPKTSKPLMTIGGNQ